MNSRPQSTTRWAPLYTYTSGDGFQREVGAVYDGPPDPGVAWRFVLDEAYGSARCQRCGQTFVDAGGFSAEHCRDVHVFGDGVDPTFCPGGRTH